MATAALPNSISRIDERVSQAQIRWRGVLAMLVARSTLCAVWQMIFAGVFMLQGQPDAWSASAAW